MDWRIRVSKDKFWLAFASIEELGSCFVEKLYNHFGCIENAWTISSSELVKVEGLTKKQISYFLEKRKNINPDECYEFILKRGIKYITLESADYPKMLKEIYNAPTVLFIKGDLGVCNLDKTLAVVGSRRASSSAKEVLNKILLEFSGTDLCVVSGLAAGIDTVAHKSALEAGVKTIGVIASGFDHCYPSANRQLYKDIADGNGAIVTEYWPTFEPLSFRFPQRNRIVSGLSYGTLIAEAALKSGAMITANLTLDQNRELMCMPGSLTNPNTEGIYKLLQDGATMVTKAEDIMNALGWTFSKNNQVRTTKFDLSEQEQKVFDIVAVEPKLFDDIMNLTKISFDDLMSVLTMLELKGIIKQIDGEKYASCVKI